MGLTAGFLLYIVTHELGIGWPLNLLHDRRGSAIRGRVLGRAAERQPEEP